LADQIGARIVVKLLTRVLIEVAVAADGVSDGRMYPDDPVSGMAFTTEGDLDTQVPRKVCARRKRPASARGLLGQPVPALEAPPLLRSAPTRRRSAALPVHELRSAIGHRSCARSRSCGFGCWFRRK